MTMETQTEKTPQKVANNAQQPSSFDFEVWAKHVRPQLLSSVQKRGSK
jgi:hypothetical protein